MSDEENTLNAKQNILKKKWHLKNDDDVFGNDDTVDSNTDSDEDYIDVDWERGVSKLEPFRKVTKAIIRSGKISDEDATRIINLTLDIVDRDDMMLSVSGFASFKKKVAKESLEDFKEKEVGHLCLKFDGK